MPEPKSRKRNQPRARFRGRKWALVAGVALIAILGLVVVVYGFWASAFDIKEVETIPQRSMVFDLDGKLYSRLQGENRIVVRRTEVARSFVDALLAREDTRFFSHHGVDPIGVIRAVVRNLSAKSAKQGGSTLTQQLARNSYPLGGKTVHRKLLEAFVAARIEQYYSKQQILEHYMNRIYFGAGVYGVETASLQYFGKSAKTLSLGEAAMLAGVIRGPTRFSPRTNLKGALQQRDQVLERMVKLDKITRSEADAVRRTPITVLKRGRLSVQENYAMATVEEDLEVLLTDEQQAQGGLKIYTTIDPALEKAAQAAVEAHCRKIENRTGYAHPRRANFEALSEEERAHTPYLQGAAVVIDNATGAFRAIVGGRDYGESPFNRARVAKRQIGSTFKAFVYAAAFDRGMLPGMLVDDAPIRRGEIAAAPTWTPDNSDHADKGLLAAEEGLIQSRNTISVRIGEWAGIEQIVRVGRSAGFDEVPTQPGIYLGAFETTLSELAAAYTVFPNRGVRRQNYIIERIDDAAGETIYRAAHIEPQVLDPATCWLTTGALQKVMERGTASGIRQMGFTKRCAGKTGTTNDYHDAWFVGFTSAVTCGVWVGLDQPKPIVARGYGATLALPIWGEVMAAASAKRYPAREFEPPAPLRRVVVCSASNGLATDGCQRAAAAYTLDLPLSRHPAHACHLHRGSVLVDRAEAPRRSPAQGLLRSFRKFFGGK